MDLDAVERNDGLNRTAGPALFEREDPQNFQLLQVRVDVGHVTLDETRCLAHALGHLFRDRPNELEAQRRETVDEVVVGAELERCCSILIVEIVGLDVLDELERVLTELFSVIDGDVECGHGRGVSGGVRSVRPGRIAADGVPVLVRARPELDKPVLHSGELDVVEVTGCGVVFVALRVLVGVVVSDEREVVESAQMERVLPARGVRLGVVGRPKHDVLDETGLDVGVLEQRFPGHLSSVGTPANAISVG